MIDESLLTIFIFHLSIFMRKFLKKIMPFPDVSKPEDIDTKSIISMQELDPSPVDEASDIESGAYFPRPTSPTQHGTGFSAPKLGLSGHHWDSWRMSGDKKLKST